MQHSLWRNWCVALWHKCLGSCISVQWNKHQFPTKKEDPHNLSSKLDIFLSVLFLGNTQFGSTADRVRWVGTNSAKPFWIKMAHLGLFSHFPKTQGLFGHQPHLMSLSIFYSKTSEWRLVFSIFHHWNMVRLSNI